MSTRRRVARSEGGAARETAERSLERMPVERLRGVGPRVAERLGALGIESVQDLLFHLPLRYQDRTRVSPIAGLRHGDEALVHGEIRLAQVRHGRRRSLVCVMSDRTGSLALRFFHFARSQQERLTKGQWVACFGEARRGPQGLEMVHPEYRLLRQGERPPIEPSLTPVYPTTEGLSQAVWRRLTDQALAELAAGALADHLPPSVLAPLGLAPLAQALRAVHRPTPGSRPDDAGSAVQRGQRRLAFEELLAQHLSLRMLRRRLETDAAPPLAAAGALERRFVENLPFALTAAQRRVMDEIRGDLRRSHPMHRLLQGDVGSGKTVVAAAAALHTIEAGYQAAFMAPTELLAEQHLESLRAWLAPMGVDLLWLGGKGSARARARALERLGQSDPAVVVGTHALFQERVAFARLGLIIVDEQHRFGVHQRLTLRAKGRHEGRYPHQLVMTATPIPRTLAMTAYADLDSSVIDELPPGRQAVETAVIPDARRHEVVARVEAACRGGSQAYWVCTLVEDSEALDAQAAERTREQLVEALPGLRIDLVHGRMKPGEKEAVMRAFKAGESDLLVATTVIEVGVDVPNASLMIIENAERLGLSQLHQLRGRVGRGSRRSVCIMLYQRPLSQLARARLNVLRETTDGFEIAQRDLELRGPGEVLGTRQTGLSQMRIADLVRDRALLPAVTKAAGEMLAEHPERVSPLVQRWVGDAIHYAEV